MGTVTLMRATGPTTSLPWWMTVAMVAAWLGLVLATVAVARSRRRLARSRRVTMVPGPRSGPDGGDQPRGLAERVDPVRELGTG